MINLAPDNHPRLKLRLHIIIGSLITLIFILIIARVADKGTPTTRTNTWGIAVSPPRLVRFSQWSTQCVKAAVFLAYQTLTTYHERFKRWASPRANMILDIIDTIFWFALFIISIMGASGGHTTSSKALGGIVAVLALTLW
ncbi:hypothetical protein BO86DRAFT_442224 [Aspergillus japonicus CBS 114.51]|uniref:MARVEL domain-containing protein n=1 Tax=Aspergillus japonicus CBS 114.51 TaxID=1448312 RepID=A0A8T8WMU4_ASPJA|nr:hypothetical protein BO86DRAFT_442224 [Aspergillus japonicus CBS 114.51]RAH76900.1 hypothetical protein BO86DRAFT_442224 [Aspergillus japonicus CBS 114.51]